MSVLGELNGAVTTISIRLLAANSYFDGSLSMRDLVTVLETVTVVPLLKVTLNTLSKK